MTTFYVSGCTAITYAATDRTVCFGAGAYARVVLSASPSPVRLRVCALERRAEVEVVGNGICDVGTGAVVSASVVTALPGGLPSFPVPLHTPDGKRTGLTVLVHGAVAPRCVVASVRATLEGIVMRFKGQFDAVAAGDPFLEWFAGVSVDFRHESVRSNVLGVPLSPPFSASVAYLALWLFRACSLFVSVSGFDARDLGNAGFAEGATLWSSVLVFAVGPYCTERTDARTSTVLMGMFGNDCDGQAALAAELHRLAVTHCGALEALVRERWSGVPSARGVMRTLLCGLQWAARCTTGDSVLGTVYADPDLDAVGVPMDAAHVSRFTLHQVLFVRLRPPHGSLQLVECSGLYESGRCAAWFWERFRWKASERPYWGYSSLKRYDARRYPAVIAVENNDAYWPFRADFGRAVGVSLERVCADWRPSAFASVAKERVLNLPLIVPPLDDPFVSSRYAAVRAPVPLPFRIGVTPQTSANGSVSGGAALLAVGPGEWSLYDFDGDKGRVPTALFFSSAVPHAVL